MERMSVGDISGSIKGTKQLQLFYDTPLFPELDSQLWSGSFNGRESTLQQLSPYIGKMKSGMARVLIEHYSKRGDVVLDPFSGSGVVPFEATLSGRYALANDLSPYAYALTRGKLESPVNEHDAINRAQVVINEVDRIKSSVDVESVPEWVKEFFHPETLREILAAFKILREKEDYFVMACLLGILHHVRPGFLSYPASHLVPYLRKTKYPPDDFPEMYTYRNLGLRLLAKVRRAYRRNTLPVDWEDRQYQIWRTNSMKMPINSGSVNAIISSPPYFGALDYARDNRLRLWFLGCDDWKELDASLTASRKVYLPQMAICLKEMNRVLKPDGHCVLVLGDVERDGELRRTAEILADLAIDSAQNHFEVENIYDDYIPDERRSRRCTRTTKFERILIMKKT
jgi:DNA modification methylase